ncbi:hypothetical protein P4W15_01955 [Morganella morganii]|nr:hypothetical protein [Morganella morganii]
MISVLVANSNEFYRAGIGAIITATPGMKMAGGGQGQHRCSALVP